MADTVVGLGRGTTHPYLHYRNSGVDWLGEVPEHWEVKRLEHVAFYRTSSVDKKTEESELPVRLCNYTDVYYGDRIRVSEGEFMNATASESEVQRFSLLVGDILVTKDSEDWRDIAVPAIVDETADDFVCGYHLGVIRSGPNILPLFLYRALQSQAVNRQLQVSASGVTRYGLPNGAIGDVVLPLPPIDEQRAIGAFLDQETERFDSLVAKIRLLIERLGEYRTALITRTVTRGLPAEAARLAGLDPSPRLKPSGMDWLGEVPEHWEVKRLKHLLRVPLQYGANEPSNLIDPESPRYIRITDIREDGMLWDETLRSIPQEVAEPYLLSEGDLLFARSGATVGKTFKYLPSWGKAAYAGYLVRARLNGHLAESDFVEYYTHSQEYKGWILGNLIQSTIQNVSAERYASLAVPLPPIDEQRAIVTFLDRETERIDSLAAKMRLLIERLGEYRTALITAAVTGKIDVRTSAESPEAHLRSRLP